MASATTPLQSPNTRIGTEARQADHPERQRLPARRGQERDVPEDGRGLHHRAGHRHELTEPQEPEVPVPQRDERRCVGRRHRYARSRRVGRPGGRVGAGPSPRPRRRAAAGPGLPHDGPALVVAPASPDLQVARREALLPEPEPPHQPPGVAIPRLNVGLQAVEPEAPERVAQDQRQAFRHVALARVRPERVVAEVGALEVPAHDLVQVDHAHDGVVGAPPDEQTMTARSGRQHPAHHGPGRLGRVDPRPMKATARPREGRERGRVVEARRPEQDAPPRLDRSGPTAPTPRVAGGRHYTATPRRVSSRARWQATKWPGAMASRRGVSERHAATA